MRREMEESERYIQGMEILLSLLLTGVFLFLSFVGHTRLALIPIKVRWFTVESTVDVLIAYYGFPFEMIGILTPVTPQQEAQVARAQAQGGFRFQVLWDGLVLNFVIYFMLALVIVYLLKRFTSVLEI